jgi:hypothetical protein
MALHDAYEVSLVAFFGGPLAGARLMTPLD